MIRLFTVLTWYLLTRYRAHYLNHAQRLAVWQRKKMKRMVSFAVKHAKFYQTLYAPYSLTDLEQLPIISKSQLVKHFSTFNTCGISFKTAYDVAMQAEISRDFSPHLEDITVGLSSGTSGQRGLFLVSQAERLGWAGAILAKMLPAPLWKRQHIAFFLRANSNIYTTLKSRVIQFSFFDLLDDMDLHQQRLNQCQPTILVAPPSVLRWLATAKQKQLLSITPIKIISVAEVLEPIDKIYIETAFNQKIHQIYQATEGFLAATCSFGTLHLNEDIIFFQKEYIDAAKTKFIPIITDLYRKTQPMIRYRLNDILTEKQQPCPCGSIYTALAQIDGRCDDLLYVISTKDGKLKPLFPDFIRRALMTSSPHILEYHVIQISPHELQINLKCNHEANDDITNKVRDNISALFLDIAAICPAIHFGAYMPPEKGVKLRRIVRQFIINDDAGL